MILPATTSAPRRSPLSRLRRALFVLLSALLLMPGCGGSACEDFCAESGDCQNTGLPTGESCASDCEAAIDEVQKQNGCGDEFEDMLDCAADADDVCNPTECTSEALDYAMCADDD